MPLPVPPDLEHALAAAPAARARFDALPPQGKDAWIAWVGRARLGSSRRRRLDHTVRTLGARRGEEWVREEAPLGPPPRPVWPWLLAVALCLLVAALLAWLLVYRDSGSGSAAPNDLVVQKGTVPPLVGRSQTAAVKVARAADLRPVVRRQDAAEAAGRVIAQAPKAGKVVKPQSQVTLVVSRGPPPKPVPDVTGLAAADAVAKLQQAKLQPKLVETASPKSPGTVVSQKPAAGAKARPGARVTLQVSKGAGHATVPSVTGESASQATSDLKAAGFAVSRVPVPSDQPKGNVVAQSPKGGGRAAKGSSVRLNVSKGRPEPATTAGTTTEQTTTAATTTTATTTVTQQTTTSGGAATAAVPRIVGQQLSPALGALERAGLWSTVHYVSSSKPAGTIVGQNPAEGASRPARSRVQVNVSEGPNPGNPVQVPDVSGEDEDTARSDLQGAGFDVVAIQRRTGDQSQNGMVVDEQPAPGHGISDGLTVAIYVGNAG